MEYLSITRVSKLYDVTPRMLRHYEKLGLIRAQRVEDYAYRMYDEEAVRRLQQIIILRKLRIPLRDIAVILDDDSRTNTLRILRERIAEFDRDIGSLSTVRDVLSAFAERLKPDGTGGGLRPDLLGDSAVMDMINALSLPKKTLKEDHSMSELNSANAQLDKAEAVRILLLPPMTVASYHYIGEDPEEKVGDVISEFVQNSRLYELKPDARLFGMNNPRPGTLENGLHGYEDWVTIPEDMELPEPLVKKRFDGGMYAVLTIPFPEFHRWNELIEWVKKSPLYEIDQRDFGDSGSLEEHLNWVYAAHMGWPEDGIDGQIDLMLPIRKREGK